MVCYETTADPPALATSPANAWQGTAIAAYRQTERERVAALGTDLAARIAALTRRRIDLEALVIDRDARRATALVDGALFQVRDHTLALLRPCVQCGVGQFPSPPIASAGDFGYALAAWELRCAGCQLTGPRRSGTASRPRASWGRRSSLRPSYSLVTPW